MNKIVIVSLFLGLFLVTSVSAYYCINPQEDSPALQDFKMKINRLLLEEDIRNGLTESQIRIKTKLFNLCR
jgi:hypothetical protein